MFSKYRNLPAKLSLASKQCRAFFAWIIVIVSHELFPYFEQEKSWFERKNAQEDPIFSACGAHPGTLTHILHYAFCDTGCRTYITLTTSRRPLRQMPQMRGKQSECLEKRSRMFSWHANSKCNPSPSMPSATKKRSKQSQRSYLVFL